VKPDESEEDVDRSIFKSLEEVYGPDLANQAWVRIDSGAENIRARTIEDHYSDVSGLALSGGVPEEVRLHFDTARNLLLYSWFVWRFRSVSMLYAYAGLELALRLRCTQAGLIDPDDTPGLSYLLKKAMEWCWIDVSKLTEFKTIDRNQRAALERRRPVPGDEVALHWAPQVDPGEFAEMLFKYIPDLRNELAHGTNSQWGNPFVTLLTCRDLIDQLYSEDNTKPA